MSEPFTGELKIVGYGFNPRGWLNCDGQLLAISQNNALFSLLGTMYGGDGRTTYGIPDLRGRVAVHVGTGPGIPSPGVQGAKGGVETVTLSVNQLPSHNHSLANGTGADQASVSVHGSNTGGNQRTPGGNLLAQSSTGDRNYIAAGAAVAALDPASSTIAGQTALAGGSQSHTNMQPYQVLRFVISEYGIYPSRN